MLDDAGISWPENAKGKKIKYFGDDNPTTIGYTRMFGVYVALVDPMEVVRVVSA